jgi:hypothetical protein
MTPARVVDGAIATRATTPAVLSGREGGGGWRASVGGCGVAGAGGQAASGFKREVTINMFLGGHVARRGGGGGTASAMAAVGNNVPRASRSAAAAFFARMDVWACGGDDGGYESRCWTARLEGGGGRRASTSLRRTTATGGIFPRRRRDGDGCGDAAVPSDRRRR